MQPAMTPQQAKFSASPQSPFALYRHLVGRDLNLAQFVWLETVTTILGGLPGILGLGMRSILYPTLFSQCGSRPAFGKNVLIRNPKFISLGKKILIDDFASLDVHGENASIALGDHVSIGRFSTVAAKGGSITLASGVNVGSYCRIATQSQVHIGESTLIAAYCYIGPGNHQEGDETTPLISRDMEIKGGVHIGAHAWIGARATIVDGVRIGERAIIGAHSLVKEDVPPDTMVAGTPARIIRGSSEQKAAIFGQMV